jgi:Fe-S cluster biosynthesis and repair protein YggX
MLRRGGQFALLTAGLGAVVAWIWVNHAEPRAETVDTRSASAAARAPSPAVAATVLATSTPSTDSSEKITLAKILPDTPPPQRDFLEQLSELNHTDKQAALTLAEKGEQWYSDVGRYAEARRAMRVTLLVDLKRMDEARALTRDFIAQYPDSSYSRLVRGVTGIHPRPSGPRVHALPSAP